VAGPITETLAPTGVVLPPGRLNDTAVGNTVKALGVTVKVAVTWGVLDAFGDVTVSVQP
jgi:hypothetical protein